MKVDRQTLAAFLAVSALLAWMAYKGSPGAQIAAVGVVGMLATALGRQLVTRTGP